MARNAGFRIRFVDELPLPQASGRGVWLERLQPLTEQPGRWAQVYQATTPRRANGLVQNLKRRRAMIPFPEHEWSFASRGSIVYARYEGAPKRRRAK